MTIPVQLVESAITAVNLEASVTVELLTTLSEETLHRSHTLSWQGGCRGLKVFLLSLWSLCAGAYKQLLHFQCDCPHETAVTGSKISLFLGSWLPAYLDLLEPDPFG
eukprot:Gb_04129 [translate_table: standard]